MLFSHFARVRSSAGCRTPAFVTQDLVIAVLVPVPPASFGNYRDQLPSCVSDTIGDSELLTGWHFGAQNTKPASCGREVVFRPSGAQENLEIASLTEREAFHY